MMPSPYITAIVLCRDGEATLDKCLDSLSFCTEIIVADDNSQDHSVDIARKHGARVLTLPSLSSFAQKRNTAMHSIQEGWILFIDADETVSSDLQQRILKAIKDGTRRGFFISRRDIFLGRELRHGETGSMRLLRLAKAGSGLWKRRVHEVWEIRGSVGYISKGELTHTPHVTLESFLTSINTYTDLEIQEKYTKRHPNFLEYPWSMIQLFLYPPGKFIYNYIFKLGLLDGSPGLFHAYCMSLHSLLVRIKTLEYLRSL